MTRIAAYVVLILVAFILASLAPGWQVMLGMGRAGEMAVNNLAEVISGSDSQTPSGRVSLAVGEEVGKRACAQCHGSGEFWYIHDINGTREMFISSPRDVHQLITWGQTMRLPADIPYSGSQFELQKPHPIFRSQLTDSERWSVSILLNSPYLMLEDTRVESSEQTFARLCSTCHGVQGWGNGPLAGDLLPRPRNLTDTVWLARQSNEYIFTVIRDGAGPGSAEGGSWSGMPAWGEHLGDEEILELANYVRSFSYNMDLMDRRDTIESDDSDADQEDYYIVPDTNDWTWEEIQRWLPGSPETKPDWM